MRRNASFSGNVTLFVVMHLAQYTLQQERELGLDSPLQDGKTLLPKAAKLQECYRQIGELFLDYLNDQGFSNEDIEKALKNGSDVVIRRSSESHS